MSDVKLKRSGVALVSTDAEGLLAYKKKKRAAGKINKMESDIAELKGMMTLILEKLDK